MAKQYNLRHAVFIIEDNDRLAFMEDARQLYHQVADETLPKPDSSFYRGARLMRSVPATDPELVKLLESSRRGKAGK